MSEYYSVIRDHPVSEYLSPFDFIIKLETYKRGSNPSKESKFFKSNEFQIMKWDIDQLIEVLKELKKK